MYRYDVDLPSTDRHVHNQKISFTGNKEEIDALKKGPQEITCTQKIGKWLVTYYGSSTGVLDIKAQCYAGNKTYVFQIVIPNKIKQFAVVDIDNYDPYQPMITSAAQFVELDDHLEHTSESFTKEYHERRYPKSSILSVYEFLKDEEFETALKSIKVEDSA